MKISGKLGYLLIRIYKYFGRRSLNRLLDQEIGSIRKDNKKNLKILNIGAGGALSAKIKQIPESSFTQLDTDENRNPDIVGDACDMYMLDDNSFDIVFALEVLEHIPAPEKAVMEIHRVLKKNGRFICSAPFMFPVHDEPHDYYRYTIYGMKYLLRSFKETEIKARNDYLNALLILMIRPIATGNKKSRLLSLFLALSALILYPFWYLLSLLYRNHTATTGYFAISVK
jgi:SAM-dependent methyltransferase